MIFSGTVPDPAKSFGSDRIQIHNTDYKITEDDKNMTDYSLFFL